MKLFRLAAAVLAAACLCAPAFAQQYDSTHDPFANTDALAASCSYWAVITPSDTTDLATYPKAVFVGGAGNLAMIGIRAPNASAGVVWKNVPAGSLLPVRPRRVPAIGTTATDILGCY